MNLEISYVGASFLLDVLQAKAYYRDLESRINYQPMRLSRDTSILLKCSYYLTKGALWTEQFGVYMERLADAGVVMQNLK